GRPGPVSIHTPDVCYGASGYTVGANSQFTTPADVAAPPAQFKTALMSQTKVAGQTQLRIFWSWSANGTWQVPDDARSAFARHPVLYKLYLVRELMNANEPVEEDPCVELMRQLLPELKRSVFNDA